LNKGFAADKISIPQGNILAGIVSDIIKCENQIHTLFRNQQISTGACISL